MARTDDQPAEETAETSVDREQGGAPRMLRKERLGARLTRYFGAEVSTEHADVLMLSCCLISGFIDSTVYNAYGTFVSMQTGNTIFVGLGASTQNPYKPYGWAKSLTSIACFILGSLFFSRFCRLLGPLRRSTFVSSFLLQSIFIFIPAAIIQASVIDGSVQVLGQRIDWKEEIPIALLSFQSAGQMVGSRTLSLSEIPTVVVTSVLCDFASDPEIASPLRRNVKRNRRVLAFTGILAGAVMGGWISKVTGGMQTVLWVAGGIKILVMCSWMLWPEK